MTIQDENIGVVMLQGEIKEIGNTGYKTEPDPF